MASPMRIDTTPTRLQRLRQRPSPLAYNPHGNSSNSNSNINSTGRLSTTRPPISSVSPHRRHSLPILSPFKTRRLVERDLFDHEYDVERQVNARFATPAARRGSLARGKGSRLNPEHASPLLKRKLSFETDAQAAPGTDEQTVKRACLNLSGSGADFSKMSIE